jgi:hypothetical protein
LNAAARRKGPPSVPAGARGFRPSVRDMLPLNGMILEEPGVAGDTVAAWRREGAI